MPPAVAEAAKVRRTVAAIRAEHRRHFAHPLFVKGSLYYHFAGKFHARRPQVQALIGVLAESPKAAMGIANWRAKEQVENAAKYRVANVFVVPGHGAWLDAALKTVAH